MTNWVGATPGIEEAVIAKFHRTRLVEPSQVERDFEAAVKNVKKLQPVKANKGKTT
jgi:hypothetical protein